jgi:sensor histidine kinase YesM
VQGSILLAAYKRSIFLINPRFQVRFSLIVCSLVYISSLVFPFVILELFNTVAKLHPQAAGALQAARGELIFYLVAYQLIFAVIVFILCIFLTHKIAGPIYKLMNYLRNIAGGAAPTRLSFRNGDHFHELAQEVNNVFDVLADEKAEDYAYLAEIQSYLRNLALALPDDKRPVLEEINQRLKDIQGRLRPNE